jgi:hypothetical protein
MDWKSRSLGRLVRSCIIRRRSDYGVLLTATLWGFAAFLSETAAGHLDSDPFQLRGVGNRSGRAFARQPSSANMVASCSLYLSFTSCGEEPASLI